MHAWVQQTLSNETKINYFVVSAKSPILISVLCMANRVLNYYFFYRHKRLDPHRIHADYKKWQRFSGPAASQLHSWDCYNNNYDNNNNYIY